MRAEIQRVLQLQQYWTAKNSSEMVERGRIVRQEFPAAIRQVLSDGASWSVEGRDGTGLKSEVPWTRIYELSSSPSATSGWYVVYLFSVDGERAWLSLNQGTTVWANGEFKPQPLAYLRDRAHWARHHLLKVSSGLAVTIDLGAARTDLAAQYEAGNVVAIEYRASSLPTETVLGSDLHRMMEVLTELLVAVGREADIPGEPSPEVITALDSLGGKTLGTRGLMRVSSDERRAIENRAIDVATNHLLGRGFRVKDVGLTESYDLHATRKRETLRVEVKGTVGAGSEVILTRNEVELHRSKYPNTMLAIVSRIVLERGPLSASGGVLRTIRPWMPDQSLLTPLAYVYQVPILD